MVQPLDPFFRHEVTMNSLHTMDALHCGIISRSIAHAVDTRVLQYGGYVTVFRNVNKTVVGTCSSV